MCSKGTFQFNVLPMGSTNAVETFQRLMNEVLKGLIGNICEVYLDDIIIYSNSLEEHIQNVRRVVDQLIQNNLKIKLSKCKIAQTKIVYLSHTISNATIRPSIEKVKDIFKYIAPLTIKRIHSFIGLGSYYRKFIPRYADIAEPLIRAANSKIITWTNAFQQAFEAIQRALSSEPVLQLPDFNKSFTIETDASDFGIEAVISQEYEGDLKPIAYFSKTLSKTERNYSASERELFAIVVSVEHFKQFLYGKRFKILTDHKPLKFIFSTKDPAPRLARWIIRMSNFDFEIDYKPGKENQNADALSRLSANDSDNEGKETNEDIMINYMFEESQYETENSETSIEKIVKDEIQVNNIIAGPENPLEDNQAKDEDLIWIYNLKLQAIRENKNHIIVNTTPLSKSRKSLYAQWNKSI